MPVFQDPPGDRPEPPIDAGWTERPLLAHIAALAARLPGQASLDDGTRVLTFAELYGMACRLGRAIVAAGLPPGPVGIKLADDAFYIVAMLGCLAAGRPCLLLSTDAPEAYTARVVRATRTAGLVVAQAEGSEGIGRVALQAALAGNDVPAPVAMDVREPALILATSGSTGEPKAVVRSQHGLLTNVEPRIRKLRTGPDDRALMLAPGSTSGAVHHRFGPLLAGATLHLVDLPRTGLAAVHARLQAAGATILRATPPILRALARLDAAKAGFARLRVVLTGGEALMQADLQQVRAKLPADCRVHYGLNMTEVSIAQWFVPPGEAHDAVRVASGYLLPGTAALLLDEGGQPSAPGEPGELVVRSGRAAEGDWVDGRMVRDRFRVDPADPERRIHRTGEIVRIFPDGVVLALGRSDRLVKVSGARVEPATIEMVARGVPGVTDAAVVAVSRAGEVRLCGFIVAATDASETILESVRTALRAALPAPMRPSELRLAAAIPLTAAGKRDDAALQRLAAIRPDAG